MAYAPDGLYPLGGYPGNDDAGRALQQGLERNQITGAFVAGLRRLHAHVACNGSVGVVGFCCGGAMRSTLVWRLRALLDGHAGVFPREPRLSAPPSVPLRAPPAGG